MKIKNYDINNTNYEQIAQYSIREVLDNFGTSNDGLVNEEVEERIEEFGENVISRKKRSNVIVRFLKSLLNPFNIVLLLISAVTFVTDVLMASPGEEDYVTVAIIIMLVLVSSLISFIQTERSNRAAASLLGMVTNTVALLRDGEIKEYPINEVVVGDAVILSAGDIIPADVRFIATTDTFISQAALTGESESVEKFTVLKHSFESMTDLSNIGYMSSNMISGSATAIVIATGNATYLGKMSKTLEETRTKNSFEKGISEVSNLLLRLMMIMLPLVFLINGVFKQDWGQSFLFAVSLAVGLTPEMLPVVMSSSLGKGAIAMSKHKTIVKDLSAIQTFGQMDILCTDKTGTLTEDKIILEKYMDVHGQDNKRILRHALINSYFQTGLKNLIDVAIINRAKIDGIFDLTKNFICVDEIPFDFNRRRMSVVLKDSTGKRQLVTKGAVEEVIACCKYVEFNNEIHELDDKLLHEAMKVYQKNNDAGLRMIAVAQKNNIPEEEKFTINDESEMVLLGFIGFLDPPKESTIPTINSLKKHGVDVMVLTGDSLGVAKMVCSKVGISIDNALTGSDIEKMSDDELYAATNQTHLFAKLTPIQKQRVVIALQKEGHTVGYMGDGINDALSLKQADVGISVDNGVDIAKETADIILLEKDLRVLLEGIIEGRKTFGNIIKYIKLAVSGNFGNMISVIAASICLPFLPMLPVHLLIQNLLCDFAQVGIPFDTVDEEFLSEPQKWGTKDIERFMYIFGPISSIFDIACFAICWFILGFNDASAVSDVLLFQTFWFAFGILSQVFIIYFIRSRKVPFIQSKPSKALVLSTVIVILVTLIIVFSPLAFILDLGELSPHTGIYLAVVVLLYATMTTIAKKMYIDKYNDWL